MKNQNDGPEQNNGRESADDPYKRKGPADAVPSELRNWQVVNGEEGVIVDGEASLIDEAPQDEPVPAPENPIKPHDDNVIVATLAADHIGVNPGAQARFSLTILNNGERPARFEIHPEGWIDEEWVSVHQNQTMLLPGARATWQIDISPPRQVESTAGPHYFAFVVRSPDYAENWCRLCATLQISPFDDLGIGELQPRRPETAWGRNWASTVVPITNRGNQAAVAHIYGDDASDQLQFEFRANRQAPATRSRLTLELEKGQTAYLAIRVQARHRHLFGMRNYWIPFQVRAALEGKAQVPERASGQLICKPLIGPWQLATLSSILIAILVLGASLLGSALVLARLNARPAPPPAPEVNLSPAVALVIEMAEPIPTRAPTAANGAGATSGPIVVGIGRDLAEESPAQSGEIAASVPDPSIPVVRPEQVSAPGAGPVDQQSSAPAPQVEPAPAVAPAPTAQPQTYAQMFEEIGGQYDLDWRMLAGQAYVESSFDPLALGRDGDLGLMQILPSTWKEWAPNVNVDDPFDTHSNVAVAAVYLDYLRTQLGQRGYVDPKWMLVAYNWGPDKLNRFLSEGKEWDELTEARRQYAIRILRIAESIP